MKSKITLKNMLAAALIIVAAASFLNLLISPASADMPEELSALRKIEATNLRLQSVLILGCLIILLIFIPRRYVILVYVLSAVLIPQDQRLIVSGIDFTALRILTLLGLARLAWGGFAWNRFDTYVVCLALVTATVYILLRMDSRAVIYRSGVLLDTIGIYWVFRQSIRGWADVKFLIKALGIGALIIVPFVMMESRTGADPFGALSSVVKTVERDEKLRCQASFVHPIVLGTFWALTLPLFYGMFRLSKNKIFYAAASCAALFMVFASNSSTPIGALVIVALLVFFFSKRYHTKKAIKGFFVVLVMMHFIFLAAKGKPIWWLFTNMNLFSGSSGWYRYYLFDCFIKHFKEWFLLGTTDPGAWDIIHGQTWDLTNQYVVEGVEGGIWGLLLFLILIISAARILIMHYQNAASREEQFLTWCVAVSFAGFLFSFFGIELYGQVGFLWYLLLAIIALIYGEQRSGIKKALNG